MGIFRGSVISIQGHDLPHSDVIALMDSYVIEMGVYHHDSVCSPELNVTRRRLSLLAWGVGYTIRCDLYDNSIKRCVYLDVPAIPVFVCSAVCLIEAHESIGCAYTAQYQTICPKRIAEIA